MHPLPRPVRTFLFFGSSFVVAAVLAFGLRDLLPYEALRRSTPEAQFQAWEGVVWMIGLVLLFLGGSIVVENVGRSSGREVASGGGRSVWSLAGESTPLSRLPWWMLSTGAALLLLAVRARTQLPG